MPSARPDRLLLAAVSAAVLGAAPGWAASARTAAAPAATEAPALLALDAAAPLIEAEIAGHTVQLAVDFGGEPLVVLPPATASRLGLDRETRPDGRPVERGQFRVAVGQVTQVLPESRETLTIAGQAISARVVTAPAPTVAGSDGRIGLPLLPQTVVRLRWRDAQAGDITSQLPVTAGRNSSAIGSEVRLPGRAGRIEVEFHPLRADSIATVSAASRLAQAGDGQLSGPARRIEIGFGVARPVRRMVLAQPPVIAGLRLPEALVRLYDWAGRSALPPDADDDGTATITGRRGRQRGWPVLKIGQDRLAGCASLEYQAGPPARLLLVCPAA